MFPNAQRVFYAKAPLVQVVCQVRFPAILRIAGEAPVAFQERVRDRLPLFEQVANAPFQFAPQLPTQVSALMGGQFGSPSYLFSSPAREYTISLSQDSLSLTANKYKTWEEFKSILSPSIDALIDLYSPAFFSRIGLRYTNGIVKERIGKYKWSDLFIAEILGELSIPELENSVLSCHKMLQFKLQNNSGSLSLQHGLATISPTNEPCYMLDFDFFDDQNTGVKNVDNTLEHLHSMVGRAFRWAITDVLHAALQPSSMDVAS